MMMNLLNLNSKSKTLNREKNKKIEELVEKINTNTDEWFLLLYKNLTSQAKREIRNVINVIKPQLEKRTLSRLINFSNLTANPSLGTELKKKVIEFAERNTIDVPDKKKYSKGARFRTTSLLCLYNSFQAEHPDDCSYQTFAKYWPVKYVKPYPS